jgi:hypothetical protein
MADSGFTLSPNTYAGQAAGQFMLASLTAADMLNFMLKKLYQINL